MLTPTQVLSLCAAGAVIAVALLGWGIRSLVGLNARGEVAVLPVLAEQAVFLTEPGDVLLALRTQQARTGFGGVSFAMRSAGGTVAVQGRPILMRARWIDLSGNVKLSVHRFSVSQPGEYLLASNGLHAGVDYSGARLVLERPMGMALPLHLLWVLGAATGLIVAVVFAMIALVGDASGG